MGTLRAVFSFDDLRDYSVRAKVLTGTQFLLLHLDIISKVMKCFSNEVVYYLRH